MVLGDDFCGVASFRIGKCFIAQLELFGRRLTKLWTLDNRYVVEFNASYIIK